MLIVNRIYPKIKHGYPSLSGVGSGLKKYRSSGKPSTVVEAQSGNTLIILTLMVFSTGLVQGFEKHFPLNNSTLRSHAMLPEVWSSLLLHGGRSTPGCGSLEIIFPGFVQVPQALDDTGPNFGIYNVLLIAGHLL